MAHKVTIIGGGSYNWTPTLVKDLLLRNSLRDSELVLMDIDPDRLAEVHRYCEFLQARIGSNWKITSTTGLVKALDSADAVILSISTGGYEAMHLDYTIPEKYGIYHTVGDTLGPGGISRALRNIPVVIDIARQMERVCPDAWLINITNPLARLRCYGWIHWIAMILIYMACPDSIMATCI